MSTFNGYQDRISNTYWTSSDVTWDGVKWSAGTVSEFTMTPTVAEDRARGRDSLSCSSSTP
jgi:hypothetical protein